MAKKDFELEHVTPYMYLTPNGADKFIQITHSSDLSEFRITLDTQEDFEVISKIVTKKKQFLKNFDDFINNLSNWQSIFHANNHIQQKRLNE